MSTEPEEIEHDEPLAPPLTPFLIPGDGKLFIEPSQATHVHDKEYDGKPAAIVGTVGGHSLTVLHTADEVAKAFGWID